MESQTEKSGPGAFASSLASEIEQAKAVQETHGPLIELRYVLSSHGMMHGSSSSRTWELSWNPDGTVILEDCSSGGGTSATAKYQVKPEIAQKLRDFVADKHLAELSKMDIKTPLVYDCFTSATIGMVFDDRSVGGTPYVRRTLQCGPAGMTFKSLEDEVYNMLKDCRETGTCILAEEKKTGNGFPGMMGPGVCTNGTNPFFNLANMVQGNPPKPRQSSAVRWACTCGFADNTGKFCTECGKPKPVDPSDWVCPACGTANKGKFCAECGRPRDRGDR